MSVTKADSLLALPGLPVQTDSKGVCQGSSISVCTVAFTLKETSRLQGEITSEEGSKFI